MSRVLGNFLALVALVFITGLHLVVLQSIASVRMVVEYSKGSTFSEGISKTIDGAHPCTMCLKIRKGRSEEKKKSDAIGYSEKKSETVILLTSVQIPQRALSSRGFETFSESACARRQQPALRPPRTVQG